MSLYCRKTLKEAGRKNAKYFFEPAKLSLEFFGKHFGLEYMFDKSDILICPEYTIGAMEYPGAITFSERYLPDSKASKALIGTRARTTMHEVSHMWFGNTVSVEWWNDTWLKESFADYIAYECCA